MTDIRVTVFESLRSGSLRSLGQSNPSYPATQVTLVIPMTLTQVTLTPMTLIPVILTPVTVTPVTLTPVGKNKEVMYNNRVIKLPMP